MLRACHSYGFCLLLTVAALGRTAAAQAPDSLAPQPPVTWTLLVDGKLEAWPGREWLSLDSVEVAARAVLAAYRQAGFYFAHLDSLQVEEAGPMARLYLTRGPEVPVGRIRLEGISALDSTLLLRQMDTRKGRRLDPDQLQADIAYLLTQYERAGFALAQVQVAAIDLLPGAPPALDLTIRVQEGRPLVFARVEVVGAQRTRPGYVRRLADLQPGRPLPALNEVQHRLEETELFAEVGEPALLIENDTSAVLRIPLREASPGTFDLVLGYLPPPSGGGSGSVVGNGHLLLRNLFGGGRVIALRLHRLPGQVSSAEARLADPFLLGTPLGAEARFDGVQQDSTYGKQAYSGELSYRFEGGLTAFTTLSREVTRPGQAGQQLVGLPARQLVPRAEALFAGLGLRFQRLDRSVNPRRGVVLQTNYERGRKERAARVVVGADTTGERTLLRQERLRTRARVFVPTFRRQVFAFGGDASLLLSDSYDQSDLFRFGGATSLRGYDEDRFLGRFVTRLFTEYRYQLDRRSYAFAFFDLGYVERPEVAARSGAELNALNGFYPGYGFGVQYDTPLGLVNASYALSPEVGPASGRIHVGLSVGL